jgi:2-methylisocitrate lyase-like PEP mutase family enzyme
LSPKSNQKFKELRVKLREKLNKRRLIVSPDAHGALYARLIEKAGFDCMGITGYGVAANFLGVPDVGLITMSEMVANTRNICRAVGIPVLGDMDTGYGNAVNAMRAAREYESAGVAGYHIEDQFFPKRCGFMKGKTVIPIEEMVGKIRACVEAREDENLVIIARTDARAVEGNEAMWERANVCAEAGADVIYAEAPQSHDDLIGDRKHIKAPLLLNSIKPEYGLRSLHEVEELGFAILSLADATLDPASKAAYDFLVEIKRTGIYPDYLRGPVRFFSADEFGEIVGLVQVREYEEKFLPKEEIIARYKSAKVPRTF